MSQPRQWKKLDNAAKIFPPTSTGKDTKVFRFICELYENVDCEYLQKALNRTIKRFPYYKFVIRKGLFWYYFEDSNFVPIVKEEDEPPCSKIYNVDKRQLLFEVTYYKKRINLEVFHAVTDGTGALQFLKTLVIYYLSEKHQEDFTGKVPAVDFDASQGQMVNDSFSKYYEKVKLTDKEKSITAYKIDEARLPEDRLGVIEARLSVNQVLKLSRSKGVTVTELLVSVLMCSVYQTMSVKERNKPVTISVPVNLRQFFPSESFRNFFCVVNISHNFKADGNSFENVLQGVKKSFEHQLTEENLSKLMNRFTTIEHNIATKIVPLAIKIPVLRAAGRVSDRGVTAALSNIGKVDLPAEVKRYVRLFNVLSSTRRLQMCMCSYNDNMMIGVTAPFINTDIQRCFFRTLSGLGLDIELFTNLGQGDEQI